MRCPLNVLVSAVSCAAADRAAIALVFGASVNMLLGWEEGATESACTLPQHAGQVTAAAAGPSRHTVPQPAAWTGRRFGCRSVRVVLKRVAGGSVGQPRLDTASAQCRFSQPPVRMLFDDLGHMW